MTGIQEIINTNNEQADANIQQTRQDPEGKTFINHE